MTDARISSGSGGMLPGFSEIPSHYFWEAQDDQDLNGLPQEVRARACVLAELLPGV